ncbi:hypothetical protein Tco_1074328, partial [Tanacetum coccineum]
MVIISVELFAHQLLKGRHEHEPEFDFDAANIPITTTGAEISTSSPEVKTAGDSIEDIAAETLVCLGVVFLEFLEGFDWDLIRRVLPLLEEGYK